MTSQCETYKNGDKQWRVYGILHRTDGPAIEYAATDDKFWYQYGVRHRDDGPAVEWAGRVEWWIDGIKLTTAEFATKLDKDTAMLWKMSGYCWPFDFGLNK